ncbi:MAG: hypothetical protein E6Q97_34910 [Desulfurellales bacterium]|nr:MAG: hypothetical protein E6Q97_34910 [Desulfurellales bacterium]
MATSRPIRRGEWLTCIQGHYIGVSHRAVGDENPVEYVRQEDFAIQDLFGQRCAQEACVRIFGVTWPPSEDTYQAAITNGTAPGLYVREGDDTSDWETYRQVLARRVEEAMAARRGGESGVDETATVTATATATRRDDEIRVGDVVEVVSCSDAFTATADVGGGGRVVSIEHGWARLSPCDGLRVPRAGFVSLADVRKVSSPPQTVAATVSPMPDGEAARIEAAVTDELRRSLSSPLASNSDETTRRRVVNPVPPAVSVSLRPRDFNAATITDYLQSLGATHIHLRQSPGNPPVVEVTGLSRQAFNTACQNLPVGVQLRAVGGFLGQRDSGETTTSPTSSSAGITRGAQSEPPTLPPQSQQPTQQPSRFSLLEVDADPSTADASPSPPQVPKTSTGLAALQQELRAEREAKRALAAAQMPPGRFDLLECDLPAAPAPAAAKPVKSPQSPRPVVSSSPPPRPRNPVETITDLTAARSPLELARMLEGLNDELSTMMRQREAN